MSNMKLRKLWDVLFSFGGLALAGLLFVGCETSRSPYNPPTLDGAGTAPSEISNRFRVGDTVRVDFSNLTDKQLSPHEEQIKDDGTITLPYVGKVQAAGKTTGELQNALQEGFKKYFREMNITVRWPNRFYSVGGEVKTPNRQEYTDGMTVIKAIQSAGDLTEFANRKKIRLTRSGKTYIINYDKALVDPRLDLPVYPGDTIHVPQRLF
jgi:protein involved in polysaccharide export with SLBB domain